MAKYQVRVLSTGDATVAMIKSLRIIADLGLKTAKDLSDYLSNAAPCVLVSGIEQKVAEHAAGLLTDAGAKVAVESSGLDTPMLLCPQANQEYQWSVLFGAVPVRKRV